MIFRIKIVLISVLFTVPYANCQAQEVDDLVELNNQIRREKFDLDLPPNHEGEQYRHVDSCDESRSS